MAHNQVLLGTAAGVVRAHPPGVKDVGAVVVLEQSNAVRGFRLPSTVSTAAPVVLAERAGAATARPSSGISCRRSCKTLMIAVERAVGEAD